MSSIVYDLTEIEGFEEDLLSSFKQEYMFTTAHAAELAKQPLTGLAEQVVILSDERFPTQTDEEILRYIQQLCQTGLKILYIGVIRSSKKFANELKEYGVEAYLAEDLVEDEVHTWLSHSLREVGIVKRASDQFTVDEVEAPQEKSSSASKNTAIRAQFDVQHPSSPALTTCVVISGSPGAGTTFVGINLATELAEREPVDYLEVGLRPCLTTWLAAEDKENTATLRPPVRPAFQYGKQLNIYTRNPLGDEEVNIRSVIGEQDTNNNFTIIDEALQDYIASSHYKFADRTIRILVTTGDIHRCRFLQGLPADIVVVNQMPEMSPLNIHELQEFWPLSRIVVMPYEPKQDLAIASGKPASSLSIKVQEAVQTLLQVGRIGGINHARHFTG